ncbi:MAG: prolipoprotein diacylglyceryl transferase [Bacilli bacterium]|nr:prolipoprotein diacylglyceryl transferase [Bacilli bacterium]
MGIVLLIIGLLFLIGGIGFGIFTIRQYIKDAKTLAMDKSTEARLLAFFAASGLAGVLLVLSASILGTWDVKAYEYVLLIIGALLFFSGNAILWTSFVIKYWKKSPDAKNQKYTDIMLFSMIGAVVLGFILVGEGAANHLYYPLVKGIQFGGSVSGGLRIGNSDIYWLTYGSSSSGGFSIAWYGVLIVFGALVCYWISDHIFYQKFNKHGILDTALLVAFPSGIIGARIGYVIGNWNGDATTTWNADGSWLGGFKPFSVSCAQGEWYRIFAIWEGGLTILGGAIGGIIVGVLFMRLRRKYVNVRWAMDVIIPTILLAQAIGRWGNFFNHEVYGNVTEMSKWMFIPTWMRYQMATGFSGGMPSGGQMYVPLFFIEGVVNFIGYFVIKYAIGKPLKKKLACGDLAGMYLIWYGATRFIMEPLRDSEFFMGSGGNWSIIWAVLYVVIGAGLIVFFHLLDNHRRKMGIVVDDEAVAPIKKSTKKVETKVEATVGEDKPLGE